MIEKQRSFVIVFGRRILSSNRLRNSVMERRKTEGEHENAKKGKKRRIRKTLR